MNEDVIQDATTAERIAEIKRGLEEVAAVIRWRRGETDREPSVVRMAPPLDHGPWGSHPAL